MYIYLFSVRQKNGIRVTCRHMQAGTGRWAQSAASVPVVTAFAQHSLLLATSPKPRSVFTT